MPNAEKVDFFKAPQRLVELLGVKAVQLLSVWFTIAGYPSPSKLRIPVFASMAAVKKMSGAVDVDLSFTGNYYLTEEEETPSVNVRISSMLSDEIQGGEYPCIEIKIYLDADPQTQVTAERFTFHAGTWTTEEPTVGYL